MNDKMIDKPQSSVKFLLKSTPTLGKHLDQVVDLADKNPEALLEDGVPIRDFVTKLGKLKGQHKMNDNKRVASAIQHVIDFINWKFSEVVTQQNIERIMNQAREDSGKEEDK